jgi:hypothetical protein
MIGFLHYRVFSFLVLLQSAVALQCGQPLTTQCLGATDVRYNPAASNNAVDQAQGPLCMSIFLVQSFMLIF